MPIPWEKLVAARKLIKLDRKQKRKAERAAIRAERRRKAEESSRSRRRTSSSSESSTTSSSSVLSSSPSRKRSRRSLTPPQASEATAGAPLRPQAASRRSVTPPAVVGEPPQRPQQPQQPKSPEVKVVGSKPAPRKEAAKIPPLPLPVAQPPPPAVPPPPQQQKKPAAAVEPIREVEVQGRIKRGLQVKVSNPEAESRSADHSHRRPAKERLGSPVNRDREEVVEKLRELAAGSSSGGSEARPPPPRRAEADKHRRTATRNATVLHEEAYAIIPIHLDDFRVVNDLVEQLQFLRHPNLREDIIKFRNVLLRRLNDQALGPEAQRAVTSYCRTRTPKRK